MLNTDKLIYPIVNLNGDKKETLIDQLKAVYEDANKLLHSLQYAMPHGRNFQMNKEGDNKIARDQHIKRMLVVEELREEIMIIYQNIYDQ